MQRPLLFISLALAAVTLACGKDTTPPPASKIVTFTGTLSGANENPAITTQGTGTFTITLDTSTKLLTWDIQVSGLDSTITAAHIHGPWLPPNGTNANVILNFAPTNTQIPGATFTGLATAKSGRAQGSLTLAAAILGNGVSGDSLSKLLLAGRAYLNVHTLKNPSGEVRAQVKP